MLRFLLRKGYLHDRICIKLFVDLCVLVVLTETACYAFRKKDDFLLINRKKNIKFSVIKTSSIDEQKKT